MAHRLFNNLAFGQIEDNENALVRMLLDLATAPQIKSQKLVKNSVLPKQHCLPTKNYFISLNIHDLDRKQQNLIKLTFDDFSFPLKFPIVSQRNFAQGL